MGGSVRFLSRLAAPAVVIWAVSFLVPVSAAAVEPGDELVVTLPGEVELALVYVAGGTFAMGSPEGEQGRKEHEDLHEVTLTRGYYLGRFEITQAQWEAVMEAPAEEECGSDDRVEPAAYGVGPDFPVYCVSWDEIAGEDGFVERLDRHLEATGQAGVGLFRLPTEAEWEQAAFAGAQTRFAHGGALDCEDRCEPCSAHDEHMWWCGNNEPYGSKEVGTRKPNAFGLYDMHGNVKEWVHDWWAPHLGTGSYTDPAGPESGEARVFRSCAWNSFARFCRVASRSRSAPEGKAFFLGFRLARSE